MAKEEIIEDGIVFHSWEEAHFYWWCKVLIKAGYIKDVQFQPKAFELSESLFIDYLKPMKRVDPKLVPESVMEGKIYTCDARIIWEDKAEGVLFVDLHSTVRKKKNRSFQYLIGQRDKINNYSYSYIEVKPVFDQNNMTKLAIVNIKWVYKEYKEFVNIVIPEKLFNKTFTPKRYFYCNKDTNRKRALVSKKGVAKIKNILSLREFLDNSSSES